MEKNLKNYSFYRLLQDIEIYIYIYIYIYIKLYTSIPKRIHMNIYSSLRVFLMFSFQKLDCI